MRERSVKMFPFFGSYGELPLCTMPHLLSLPHVCGYDVGGLGVFFGEEHIKKLSSQLIPLLQNVKKATQKVAFPIILYEIFTRVRYNKYLIWSGVHF